MQEKHTTFFSIPPAEQLICRGHALHWAAGFEYASVLGHHGQLYPYGTFPDIIAAGAEDLYTASGAPFAPPLGKFWIGALSYDLGTRNLGLKGSGKEDFCFFSPLHLLQWSAQGVSISSPTPEIVWQAICKATQTNAPHSYPVKGATTTPMAAYTSGFNTILKELQAGNVYEANLCRTETASRPAGFGWADAYQQLARASPMPFQFGYLSPKVCMAGASPERFLRKEGPRIISQPIKGTSQRGGTAAEDLAFATALMQSEKARAENMMITDLVRNDLIQICLPASVQVPEFLGLYSFSQVHQLITTVTGSLAPDIGWAEILRATFPMGSMAGAPKLRALEIIAEAEDQPRGYFSGAIGYILPSGDFDFAVVIRTLFLTEQQVYYRAGGAIVWDSELQEEYQEASLKMAGIRHALAAYKTDALVNSEIES